MKSQMFLLIFTCLIITSSCRNSESQRESETLNNNEEEFSPVDRNIPRQDVENQDSEKEEEKEVENDSPDRENSNREESSKSRSNNTSLSGNYIKVGQESDNNCGCYCIDLNFSSNVEMCLIPNVMYISARLQRKNDDSINVFLVDPSTKNSQGKDIPWKDFDRNSPIATITPKSNGNLDVDWLGFTINGDLAMDYAILGKKTLEGSYKKK